MKRKSLSVEKKAKVNNPSVNNSKTKKLYTKFRKKILKKVGKDNFAIGVSGGADSLCLAYLSNLYSTEFNFVSRQRVDFQCLLTGDLG